MKKIIFSPVIYLLLISDSFSQPFGANNAIWHYHWCSFPPVYCSPIIITSVPSDTVNGIIYYTVTRNDSLAIDCSLVPSPDTVYESNDTVYYYLANTNRYAMLYNWNALPGDTEIIYVDNLSGGEDSLMLTIDSISTININGFTKRVFHTTQLQTLPSQFIFGYQIIEDIGSTAFLFPQLAFCDPLTLGLRCYEDTIIGLYQPWQPGSSCDTIIYLGENELNYTSEISILPNPVTDFLSVSFNAAIHKEVFISVFNVFGEKAGTFSFVPKQELKLSMKENPPGIYFIIINTGGKEEIKKVVKL